MTLLSKNGSTPHNLPAPWLCKTTRDFFSSINWEDHPPEVQELKLATTTDASGSSLSLLLTVQQFFSAVNWDGTAVAPSPSLPASTPDELMNTPNSLTLDDFSDLF